MYMIMFVLNDPARLDEVLKAWDAIGIPTATIVESTSMRRRRRQKPQIPMRYMFEPLHVGGEEGNYTLFVIVEDETRVQQCLDATEKLVGDLTSPDNGVLVAWKLDIVKGIGPKDKAEGGTA